jgi:adenylylsulfate kinase-like enzyme
MAWIIYLTGLPGSGKSTIGKELLRLLNASEMDASMIRLDEIRKQIIPNPVYSQDERELVYHVLNQQALDLYSQGKNVILDATAYKLKWRSELRQKAGKFVEVFVRCSLDVCIARESQREEGKVEAEIYRKAIERKNTGKHFPGLGEVVGIDVTYEENQKAEVVIDSDKTEPAEAARIIYSKLMVLSP